MRNKHPLMKLSPEETHFLRHWMYEEMHYQEGGGPAKQLQRAHHVISANLAVIIAAVAVIGAVIWVFHGDQQAASPTSDAGHRNNRTKTIAALSSIPCWRDLAMVAHTPASQHY